MTTTEKEIREHSIRRLRRLQELLDNAEFEFEKYRTYQSSLPTYTLEGASALRDLRMSLRYLQLAIQEVMATADTTAYLVHCIAADVEPSDKQITLEELDGDKKEVSQ